MRKPQRRDTRLPLRHPSQGTQPRVEIRTRHLAAATAADDDVEAAAAKAGAADADDAAA